MAGGLTFQRALLGTVVAAILVGIVPAGFAFDRRLDSALIARARSDLEMAPRVLADRAAARADALKMHASDFAHAVGLGEAISRGDRPALRQLVDDARRQFGGGEPVVVAANGTTLVGPPSPDASLDDIRRGATAVSIGVDSGRVFTVALAPVVVRGTWVGAAGIADPIDAPAADALARLTRSDVTILVGQHDSVAVTTLDSADARRIRTVSAADVALGHANEVEADGRAYLTVVAPLGTAGRIVFSRSRAAELAVIPQLRRVALISALVALGIALLLGAILASRVTQPARDLSNAATAMASGSFDAPLPQSRIHEIARVAEQFDVMRTTLARQMRELRDANETLADRNARLTALQADLMQRDRLAATGRLVGQLAHEIRNPVANLRNLLELIRRGVEHDPLLRDYADLAIDELLRMHELAEQMLDLNRPRDPAMQRSDPVAVAREVARLATAGAPNGDLRTDVQAHGAAGLEVAIAPDALKQVLVNLVQNARDAAREAGRPVAAVTIVCRTTESGAAIEVIDNGPGVPESLRARIFDPFFTTKNEVDGVGLGLFVAEGLVRSAGGRLAVQDAPDGGAQFTIELSIAAHPAHPARTAVEPEHQGVS